MQRTRGNRIMSSLFLIIGTLLCLSGSSSRLVSGSCTWGDSSACSGAGVCTNITVSGATSSLCLCDAMRYESDSDPSILSTDATCIYSLSDAAPSLTTFGSWVVGACVVATFIATLAGLARVIFRRAGRESRFERLRVAGTDVLKPTPAQLRHARWAFSCAALAAFLWMLDSTIDPLGSHGTINTAGGLKRSLADDGTTTLSGVRLRDILEDASELALFVAHVIFFLLFRKVCVPAPALLSGKRFRTNWRRRREDKETMEAAAAAAREKERERTASPEEAMQAAAAGIDGLAPTTSAYVRAATELAAAERAIEEDDSDDSAEARDRRWLAEQQRVRRSLRRELQRPDTEIDMREVNRVEARAIALQRKQAANSTMQSDARVLPPLPSPPSPPSTPPPPPASPPRVPAPPPEERMPKSASKYAVAPEPVSAPSPTPDPPPRAAPIVAPNAAAKPASAKKKKTKKKSSRKNARDKYLADGATASENAGVELASSERVRTADAHVVHVVSVEDESYYMSQAPSGQLPSDQVAGVALEDVASLPVPDSLKATHLMHVSFAVLAALLLIVGDIGMANARAIFSVGLFVMYIITHIVHFAWMITYWDPLYLISLKEEVLQAAGLRLPRHRLITASAGSATSASTSTVQFGVRTAYELSKVHDIYQLFLGVTLLITLAQNCTMLYLGAEDELHLGAEIYTGIYILNKLLQCVRVIGILLTFYPFQPIIQYLSLHSFWLDQRLEWTAKRPLEVRTIVPHLFPKAPEEVPLPDEEAPSTRPHSAAGMPTPKEKEKEVIDYFPSTRLSEGCLICLPLYVSTSFRPIPTRDEVAAKREAEMMPLLLADLKRMRALDRASARGDGSASAMSRRLARLWTAGARHQQLFLDEPSPALAAQAAHGDSLERAIAHQQFVLWRRQHLRDRGWARAADEQPYASRAAREEAAAEKMVEAAVQARGQSATVSLESTPATAKGDEEVDAFQSIQERYNDPDGSRALAAARAQAKATRAAARQSKRADLAAAAQSATGPRVHPVAPSRLPPLAAAASSSASPARAPATKVRVVLNKLDNRPLVIRDPASSPPPYAPAESSTSGGGGTGAGVLSSPSGSRMALLPGSVTADGGGGGLEYGITPSELRGVLDDPDDFVSVSRDSRAQPIGDIYTPRAGHDTDRRYL